MSVTDRLPGVPWRPSPNYSDRPDDGAPSLTVIHGTAGGSANGAVTWLCNPESKASAHFVIDRDGSVVQLVGLTKAAWHAGAAAFQGKRNVNGISIGIELANVLRVELDDSGFVYRIGATSKPYRHDRGWLAPKRATLRFVGAPPIVEGWWEPYPEAQLTGLEGLLFALARAEYAAASRTLVGHEEVATPVGRKSDPGPLFPWARFGRPADGPCSPARGSYPDIT